MMAANICERIGVCKVDGDGKLIEIKREFFRQGWVFKDWGAFRDSMDAPCYVPELDDTAYTKRDFLELCNGQENIAEELFNQLDWQSPSTLFNEWEDIGAVDFCERCEKLFLAFGIEQCPYCGKGRTDK